MIETIITFICAIFFALGAWVGYEVTKPTEQQVEIIDKACEYIYENEPLEVYTQYCK
mgnify:FL=1